MIVRPFTFLTGLIFAVSGAYLFVVKHQSQSLEDGLGQLAHTSRVDEQAIRVLKAQWALEADPSRIAALATSFTQLKPMQPNQLVTLASLSASLPAPGSAPPYSNPEDLVPDMPGEAGGAPAPSGPAIQVRGHDVADAGGQGAAVTGTASQSVADNQAPAIALPEPPPVAPHYLSVHLAAARTVSRSWIAPIPPQTPVVHKPLAPPVPPSYVIQTRAEAVVLSPGRPLGAQIVRIKAVARPTVPVSHHEISAEMPLDGGSLLGMAQSGSQN